MHPKGRFRKAPFVCELSHSHLEDISAFFFVVVCVSFVPFGNRFSGLRVAYYWATEIDQNKHDKFKGEFKIC